MSPDQGLPSLEWIGRAIDGKHDLLIVLLQNCSPPGVEEGADTIVWLATLPTNGPSGGFFRDRKRIGW